MAKKKGGTKKQGKIAEEINALAKAQIANANEVTKAITASVKFLLCCEHFLDDDLIRALKDSAYVH